MISTLTYQGSPEKEYQAKYNYDAWEVIIVICTKRFCSLAILIADFVNIFCFYREDICLQTLLLLFKYANHKNKRSFVATTNEALVGILMTIGDVNNIFPIL